MKHTLFVIWETTSTRTLSESFLLFHHIDDSLFILLLLFDNQAHDLHHNIDHLSHCPNKLKDVWKAPKQLSTWKWSSTQLKILSSISLDRFKCVSLCIITSLIKETRFILWTTSQYYIWSNFSLWYFILMILFLFYCSCLIIKLMIYTIIPIIFHIVQTNLKMCGRLQNNCQHESELMLN